MAAATAVSAVPIEGHRLWARLCHWLLALGFLGLAFSGVVILMAHPRLYWGEVGNALTPAILEFPINDNHRPEGWEQTVVFDNVDGAPISANRMYRIFNENRWARSLHFLSGWVLFFAGAAYVLAGLVTGHIRRNLLPRLWDLAPRAILRSVSEYARQQFRDVRIGPPYSLPQRLAYAGVVLVFLPFMVISGLTMAPTITAAYPVLLDIFGGYQSARTLHFVGFVVLFLFLVAHLVMVVLTGFRRQLRAMILGS
jgi:thiosulfate reductase cytochrome b subunit